MKKVAIIGAGLTGLTIAQELNTHLNVTIFEKSRGVGGRIATRRANFTR
jgi:predicted NAD/FAD-dependent oxidoreductase